MTERQAGQTARLDNPLMPDERLRQMYTAMVQMRMLEEYLDAREGPKPGRVEALRGQEAARAATALSLGSGDLISDCSETAEMDLLLGAKLGELKRWRVSKRAEVELDESYARRLPLLADGEERLQLSIGAGTVLKTQRGGRVLLVYVHGGEVKPKRWKKALRAARQRELPVIFVVLPELRGRASDDVGGLCLRSREWGVPAFPVDGSDAVALYRVIQESLLRARLGDGPALIECIRFDSAGKKVSRPEDPLERLAELMLAKGVANGDWIARTRAVFAKRLGVAGR